VTTTAAATATTPARVSPRTPAPSHRQQVDAKREVTQRG
jgi:hypothetical protein